MSNPKTPLERSEELAREIIWRKAELKELMEQWQAIDLGAERKNFTKAEP